MSMMRSILNKPTTVVVFSVLLFVISIFMLTLIPQQYMPNMTLPYVTVTTSYSGAGPEEVENSVTKLLERQLVNVSNLDTLSSTSSEGVSNITMAFNWGINLDVAINEVRDKLDQVRDYLPDGARAPIISKLDINSMMPVMVLTMRAPMLNADELKPYAEDVVQPMLEQLDGVGSVSLFGGREFQVRVEVLQNRLEAYNITMSEVNGAIRSQNLQMGAGSIMDGDRRILLRANGQFQSPEDVAKVVVGQKVVAGGRTIPILLRDIANVSLNFEDETIYSEMSGQGAFILQVYKASDANIVATANNVFKAMPHINDRLPSNMEVEIIWSSSRQVTNAIWTVVQSASLGALFSVIVLLLFLRNIKSAIIVAITMPLSIAFTLMMMYYFDLTLNVLSLAGLNLGVALIIDGGVVMLENITRYREKGTSSKTSAILGSQEMVSAVTGSILTTVAVFLPMVIFRKELGIVGVIFTDLSFTIVIALLSSLLFAVVLVPVLAGIYLPVRTTKQRALSGFMAVVDVKMGQFLSYLDGLYANSIKWALGHRKFIVIAIFASLVVSMVLLATAVRSEMMPSGGSDMYFVSYTLPQGTPLEVTKDVGQQLVGFYQKDLGSAVKEVVLIAGSSGGPNANSSSNAGGIMLLMPPFKQRTLDGTQLAERVRQFDDFFPDATYSFSSMNSGGGGGSSRVSFKIRSQDQVALEATANRMVEILNDIPILREVTSNLDDALPRVEVEIDRNKSYSLALNVATIAQELNANINGTAVAQYSYNGKDIDIYTRLQESDRSSLSDLDRIFFKSPMGQNVVLSNIASLKRGFGQVAIKREDQTRQLTISAKMGVNEAGKPVAESEASTAAKTAFAEKLILPDNVTMVEGGNQADFAKLVPKILGIMLVGMLLVYGIMASQFESLSDPFIIILTIVTLPIGPILIYVFSGSVLSAYSLIGFIMLLGIVTSNGIVLVSYTNLLRKRGELLFDAIVEAGRSRLRPILITSLTTILGMLPMALNHGEGTEMTQPIGTTVFGGMISSTFMTLFFVPVLYYVFNRKNEAKRLKALEERKEAIKAGRIHNGEV